MWGGCKALPPSVLLPDGGDRRGVWDGGGAPGWSRPREDHEPLLHPPQVQSEWGGAPVPGGGSVSPGGHFAMGHKAPQAQGALI